MLVGCATAASLFPFVGTIIYMILRPPEYLEDVRERELEMQAAEARLHELDHALCPHCDYRIERDFVRCPSCLRKLKERCVNCSRPLDQAWTICPYCEAEVPGRSARRARRRRAAARERAASRRATRAARASPDELARGDAPPRSDAPAETATAAERRRRAARPPSRPPSRARAAPRRSPAPDLLTRTAPLTTRPKGRHGPNADPRQARRLRARA